MQNINPFDLFKEELDNDEISVRINAVHKLPIVGTLMTSDAIKNVLLPYLDNLIKKEDDEVVFAIAEEYTNLAPMLGAQHTLVLPYLETLCAHDQTVIRERAASSVNKLIGNYTDNEINNFIVPLIIRLSSNQANFTNRASATLMMCKVYPRAGPNKDKIRQKFMDISNEEMLLLQRATAMQISDMCYAYEKTFVISDLISILKRRSTEEQDQIRVLAIESFESVSKMLTHDENKTFIMPLIIQAAEDKSWRVRLCLSKNFTQIAKNFGDVVTDLSLVQTYGNLLRDPEVDVKIEAVKSLDGFIEIVSKDKLSSLIPQVLALGKDALGIVRSHAGGIVSKMIGYVQKEEAYQNIQPMIKDLMKDDSQEVRRGGILAAAKFIEVIGPESFSSLAASIKQCSEDGKWRVRLQVINDFTDLAIKMKNMDFFSKQLEVYFLNYLKDRASAIRRAGVGKIQDLGNVYGKFWLGTFVNKQLDLLQKQTSYHYKITCLYSMKEACLVPTAGELVEKCTTAIFKASHDTVPNVREASVKCLREIGIKWEKSPVKESIRKHLAAMTDDEDKEVKEKAAQTLAQL